jgi:glycosyltransferase involved in cell wall biosynthesis
VGIRALWVAPALWTATGYGQQSRLIVPRLLEQPEVDYIGIAAHTGLQYGRVHSSGVDHIPFWNMGRSDDVLRKILQSVDADTVFTMADLWALSRDFGGDDEKGNRKYNWYPYCPIDSWPLSIENRIPLSKSDGTLVNSIWGKKVCEAAGFEAHYIPHVVDTKVFRPLPDKRALRKKFGFPEEAFLVGMVAANKGNIPLPRKGFQFAFEAFVNFKKQNPKAFLYLHTSLQPATSDDAELNRMAMLYGLNSDCVRGLNVYLATLGVPEQELVEIYNCFDVLLSASLAESVNVPLLEAAACGVFIVATDTSGQTEHVGVGVVVAGLTTILTPQCANWVIPDVEGLTAALVKAQELLADKKKRREFRKESRAFAEHFDVDKVVKDYWVPFLQEITAKKP